MKDKNDRTCSPDSGGGEFSDIALLQLVRSSNKVGSSLSIQAVVRELFFMPADHGSHSHGLDQVPADSLEEWFPLCYMGVDHQKVTK